MEKYICNVILALCVVSCGSSAQEDGLGHHHHDHGGGNKSDEIVLSPQDAERFGVYSQMVKPREFNEVVKVSGQIITAPTEQSVVTAHSSGVVTFKSGIVQGRKIVSGEAVASVSAKDMTGGDANEAAKIAYESAKRELERVEPLYKDGIVSVKDYNAIKRAFDEAAAAYTGNENGSVATAQSSGVITQLLVENGEYVEAGRPIAAISGNMNLTLRADLPEKYYDFLPTIVSANFRTSYNDEVVSLSQLNGRKISSSSLATAINPGYIPVYFSFDNDGSVIPGSFVEVYLIGASRQNVIVLPVDAITEQQGKYYVYVKLDDECYEKRMVTTGRSNGNEIEILSGLTRRDEVVSHGAVIVRLAESSGAVPEGHSHNH